MIDSINELFQRELKKLEEEILSFTDESLLRNTTGEIKNSAGNLCLHLCGGLQHFIGANLGKTGYVRNREAEFASLDFSKATLLSEIQKTKSAVFKTLSSLSENDLQKIYPQNFLGKDVNAEYFLMHLLSHFDYHLGQINYARRMSTGRV